MEFLSQAWHNARMIPYIVFMFAGWLNITDVASIVLAQAIVLAGVILGLIYLAVAIFIEIIAAIERKK